MAAARRTYYPDLAETLAAIEAQRLKLGYPVERAAAAAGMATSGWSRAMSAAAGRPAPKVGRPRKADTPTRSPHYETVVRMAAAVRLRLEVAASPA